ncbi:MAG: SBBP repeat-containing protein, partial [Caldilineaceae bacterium]|nr:SBBP repeat-containing protein [Caldilineaceae bacterium]
MSTPVSVEQTEKILAAPLSPISLSDTPLSVTEDFTKTLAFSTYVDPDGFTTLYDIAVDTKGNSVVVGNTTSHSVTLVSPYQATWSCEQSGRTVGVLFKFAPSGEEVLFSSYFGVGCGDKIEAVDVDAEGNIYIAGTTESDDFPLLNPLFSDPSGLRSFIAKFSPDGSQLLFSTILPRGIIADLDVSADGFIYIAGYTSFDDLPVKNALYPQKGGDGYDAFVGKLKADGSELIYLTYLGGELQDRAESVAAGPDGSVYVTGFTYSDDFPTKNPIENLGALFAAFVTHISSDGSSLVSSTYLGGTDNTHGFAIDVDANGSAYVTGHTLADDFPTTVNAYMPDQPSQDWSTFVAKISKTGTLQYGTYYGAADGQTLGYGIAVDKAGFAYLTGNVTGQQLPLVYPIQDARQGTRSDIFVAKLDQSGSELLLSTYMGSDGVDQGIGIAVDKNAAVYLTGLTRSAAWPTTADAYVETVTPINPANYLNSYVARLTTLPWTFIIYSAYDNDLTFQQTIIDAFETGADNPNVRFVVLI